MAEEKKAPATAEDQTEEKRSASHGRPKSNSEKKRRRAIRELTDIHDQISDGDSVADIRKMITVRIALLEKENREYLKAKEASDGDDQAEDSSESPAEKPKADES